MTQKELLKSKYKTGHSTMNRIVDDCAIELEDLCVSRLLRILLLLFFTNNHSKNSLVCDRKKEMKEEAIKETNNECSEIIKTCSKV